MKVLDLLKLNPEFKLYSGSSGGNNIIKYIDIVEIPEGYHWIKEGDFIITTGYYLDSNPEDFSDFVQQLISARACGLDIKLGKFIKKLPPCILELSNHYSFPIISIPLNLSYRDIIKPVMHILSNEDSYFKELFKYESIEKFYLTILTSTIYSLPKLMDDARRLHISYYSNRCLCIFKYAMPLSESHFDRLYVQLKTQYPSNQIVCIHQRDLSKIVCTFDFQLSHFAPHKNKSFFTNVYNLVSRFLSDPYLTLGISNQFDGLANLNMAYKCADSALRIGFLVDKEYTLFFYNDYMVDNFIFDSIDHYTLTDIYLTYILKLIHFDEENKMHLYPTLVALVKNDFNLNHTANALFIHRNTLYNRITKINQVLDCNIEQPDMKLLLALAIKLSTFIGS